MWQSGGSRAAVARQPGGSRAVVGRHWCQGKLPHSLLLAIATLLKNYRKNCRKMPTVLDISFDNSIAGLLARAAKIPQAAAHGVPYSGDRRVNGRQAPHQVGRLIQVREVDMKWGRDSPKVIPPPLNGKIAWLNKPQPYLTTKLTSLPGTQIAFTTVLPSIHLAAASSAAARISSCVAVAEISTRQRSLPST